MTSDPRLTRKGKGFFVEYFCGFNDLKTYGLTKGEIEWILEDPRENLWDAFEWGANLDKDDELAIESLMDQYGELTKGEEQILKTILGKFLVVDDVTPREVDWV